MSTATAASSNGHPVSVPAAVPGATPPPATGLHFEANFDHLSEPDWTRRSVAIRDDTGAVIFTQEGVEAPAAWSDRAVTVAASRYFHGAFGSPERETSVRGLIDRVAATIALWGDEDGYFDSGKSRNNFFADLTALLTHQHGAFNSPVWFNLGLFSIYGIEGRAENWRWDRAAGKAVACKDSLRWPMVSACFIQSVEDNMASIMALATSEAMLFKHGSGTGSDLSTIRSTKESLAGGGKPSGPVSFMRVYDAVAGVVKSGGKTRRAAKMQTLNIRHPDVIEFIDSKPIEDRKARVLAAGGYSGDINGDAYGSVLFQNSNLSVRLTDEFLRLAEADDPNTWITTGVQGGRFDTGLTPRQILDRIAAATWECGDPALQFDDTTNAWHTTPASGRINSSNPCAEYVQVDDSACNLASFNLLKFRREDGSFDVARFRAAVRIFIVAQEILVDRACYPTAMIAANSHRLRPLGLGYANLGAYLMRSGLAYDSVEGRSLAGAITATMTAQAYLTSAELADKRGAFEGFALNGEPMLGVIDNHRRACEDGFLGADSPSLRDLWDQASKVWAKVCGKGRHFGFRNAQVTLLAPTGTIGFLMDCDTFGLEPELLLAKDKALSGGGTMRIVNGQVGPALEALGYGVREDRSCNGDTERFDEVQSLVAHVERTGSISGPYQTGHAELKPEHLAVFDCALAARPSDRCISPEGHLRMMAAVQPFLSGAISKTVNLPESATVADIRAAYLAAWHLGLKAVAVYRDNSKGAQPLTAIKPDPATPRAEAVTVPNPATALVPVPVPVPVRRRLPDTRPSVTHKFTVGAHEGYLTAGLYPDGQVGEVFVQMAKEGSTTSGVMDAWATALSLGLQYGVPLAVLVSKFSGARYEPAGFTRNPEIPVADSLTDYIIRFLGTEFLPGYRADHAPRREESDSLGAGCGTEPITPAPLGLSSSASPPPSTGRTCPTCGDLTIPIGRCEHCPRCFWSGGCS